MSSTRLCVFMCDACVCLCAQSRVPWVRVVPYYVSDSFLFESEMHPGKESRALHPEDRDEDVGDKDKEDDDSYDVVHAV